MIGRGVARRRVSPRSRREPRRRRWAARRPAPPGTRSARHERDPRWALTDRGPRGTSSTARPSPAPTASWSGSTPQSAGWDFTTCHVYRLAARPVRRPVRRRPGAPRPRARGPRRRQGGGPGPRRRRLADHGVRRPALPGDPGRTRSRPSTSSRRRTPSWSSRRPGGPVRRTALVAPEDILVEKRGSGNTARRIHHLLPPSAEAGRLIAFEVFTPGGNWSSYPPHKHDTENPPVEARLEELYFYRFAKPQGFAFARVYTADRSLDEAMTPSDCDVVLVPEGYHPVGAPARLRLLLPQRHGRPQPRLALHHRPRPRLAHELGPGRARRGHGGRHPMTLITVDSPLSRMVERTPTDFWNDSCAVAELAYAVERGGTGATSNPVIVGEVMKKEKDHWVPRVREMAAAQPHLVRGRAHLGADRGDGRPRRRHPRARVRRTRTATRAGSRCRRTPPTTATRSAWPTRPSTSARWRRTSRSSSRAPPPASRPSRTPRRAASSPTSRWCSPSPQAIAAAEAVERGLAALRGGRRRHQQASARSAR